MTSPPPAGTPATLHVGCPMWAHRPWIGSWLPASTSPSALLAAYATVCNAVEGNTTFYAVPSTSTVQRWAAQTPPGFRFCFKLPRTITHERRLRDAGGELAAFLERIAPLADRCGPCSVQLPASFGPTDLATLRTFLGALPRSWRWAVEVRHEAFFDGAAVERALNDTLFEHDVDRVILDSRALFAAPAHTPIQQETQSRKPRLPVRAVAIGRHPTVRFIGQDDPEANPPFWQRWVDTVVRWLAEGRSPFVFLHTPDNAASPGLARRFHAEVRARLPELAPLPEPPLLQEPDARLL